MSFFEQYNEHFFQKKACYIFKFERPLSLSRSSRLHRYNFLFLYLFVSFFLVSLFFRSFVRQKSQLQHGLHNFSSIRFFFHCQVQTTTISIIGCNEFKHIRNFVGLQWRIAIAFKSNNHHVMRENKHAVFLNILTKQRKMEI